MTCQNLVEYSGKAVRKQACGIEEMKAETFK